MFILYIVISSFMIFRRICNNSNATDASTEAGSVYPPEHKSSCPFMMRFVWLDPGFFYEAFCRSYFVCRFSPFSFGHIISCYCSSYRIWLPIWYFQTFMKVIRTKIKDKTPTSSLNLTVCVCAWLSPVLMKRINIQLLLLDFLYLYLALKDRS